MGAATTRLRLWLLVAAVAALAGCATTGDLPLSPAPAPRTDVAGQLQGSVLQ